MMVMPDKKMKMKSNLCTFIILSLFSVLSFSLGDVFPTQPFFLSQNSYFTLSSFPNVVVSTLVGGSSGNQDGTGTAVKYTSPSAFSVSANGKDIFLVDQFGLHKVSTANMTSTSMSSKLSVFSYNKR